ncbi:MAG: hypothetical protein HYV93_07380 [Candidatus Rokubacteria bacterium]|nr:hypothetical protein [Candidatus Rokubacteria bacterium]
MGVAGPRSITVEVTTWVTRYVGGDGSGSRLFEEPVAPGETLRALLRRLGVAHELSSPLRGGERITLLGQFMGGARAPEPAASADRRAG